MKRILIIIANFRHGGTNRSLQNLLSIIDTKNYCVEVFAFEYYGHYMTMLPNCNILKNNLWLEALIARFDDTKGIARIRSLFLKVARNLCNYFGFDLTNILFRRVAKRLSNGEYDVAIAYSEYLPTIFASHLIVPNKIAWIHCDYSEHLKIIGELPEVKLYSKFNIVVCVSEYTKNVFINCIPFLKDRVHAIHNIINAERVINSSKELVNIDKRFDNLQFTIISVGRIDSSKGFLYIPKIVSNLNDEGCIFKWYIIGGVTNKEEYSKLLQYIKSYNVMNNLICLGEKDNPYPYILNSDLMVSTSISEAFPYVISEAKLLQTPVVTTNFKSAVESIVDQKEGFIVPIEEIGNKIKLLITNKSIYNQIKMNLSTYNSENENILRKIYAIL